MAEKCAICRIPAEDKGEQERWTCQGCGNAICNNCVQTLRRHDFKHWRTLTEKAYRRGVHQVLAMLDRLIHDHLNVDPASVFDVASSTARTYRYDRREHAFLVHDLIREVKDLCGIEEAP